MLWGTVKRGVPFDVEESGNTCDDVTSLDLPVLAPLVDFRQNRVRFCGLPFASVDNANNYPIAATRNRSRCLLPWPGVTARPPSSAGHRVYQLFATLAWATSETDRTRGDGLLGP